MRKWQEFSGPEKRMVIVIVVLLLGVLLTIGRVKNGVGRGFSLFVRSPADTAVSR